MVPGAIVWPREPARQHGPRLSSYPWDLCGFVQMSLFLWVSCENGRKNNNIYQGVELMGIEDVSL